MLYYEIIHFLLSLKLKRRSMEIYADVRDIGLSSMRLRRLMRATLQEDRRWMEMEDVVGKMEVRQTDLGVV